MKKNKELKVSIELLTLLFEKEIKMKELIETFGSKKEIDIVNDGFFRKEIQLAQQLFVYALGANEEDCELVLEDSGHYFYYCFEENTLALDDLIKEVKRLISIQKDRSRE